MLSNEDEIGSSHPRIGSIVGTRESAAARAAICRYPWCTRHTTGAEVHVR